ncbi:hypothetical protein GP486_001409 [Trichoglossum hirsutum]|uniref:Peroxin/Ferlin domain-containing protein n=1 Tax=Trichoglossum hirsutum TaxID=265104 RepID=A0A9P8LH37_9PEZI|nr:hypothetical protein GP486_001409 [Trichoglossum hirsutum]
MSTLSLRRESTAATADHQILLLDNSLRPAERQAHPDTEFDAEPSASPPTPASPTSPVSPSALSPRNSDTILSRKWSLREELARRKYSKWQERRFVGDEGSELGDDSRRSFGEAQTVGAEKAVVSGVADEQQNNTTLDATKEAVLDRSEVDILYENQRGTFMCGIPLFSSKSLLNLDPSPWVNAALKDSPVDIMNAQVPDPSWRWAWKSWYVDMSADVDEEGWQYSFSFSPTFPWHGTHVWLRSFVRRRRWLRKRVRISSVYDYSGEGANARLKDGHMLNPDYFTIHPKRHGSRSWEDETMSNGTESRWSYIIATELDEVDLSDIQDIASLMKALRKARIDREKIEAVETFLEQGGEEIVFLADRMPEIMASFVFQASRRQLLAHLSRKFDVASSHRSQHLERGEPEDDAEKRKVDNLLESIHAADEQVKRLEFWSDVKAMAREGDGIGTADDGRDWSCRRDGPNTSGPARPHISSANLEHADRERTVDKGRESQAKETLDKGKGKA